MYHTPAHKQPIPKPARDPFFDPMVRTVNRNLVKYAAGSAIFCPFCSEIMDAKRTVVLSAGSITKVVCARCWDTNLKPLIKPETLARCEILDGRVLWSKRG